MQRNYSQNPHLFLSAMFYLIIFIGAFLAIYQFIFNRSLWLDEASLALNIINKNFIELTTPLDYYQVAPIGFLFIEKISTLLFGKNEFALRIFPLISFLLSIPFFYLLSNKLSKNNVIALISTSFFSISYSLLYYSSEVKQYSSDVLLTIIILFYTLTLQLNKDKSLFIYAIIGGFALWISNISVIILFVAGIYTLYIEGYRNKNYKILLPLLFWAASFLVYYFLFIHNHSTTEIMMTYWEKSFLPINPFSKDFYIFLYQAIQDIYFHLLNFGIFWFFALIISLSAIEFMLKQKKYALLFLCLTPVVVNLLLSGLKLYPFSGRLILYIVPLILFIFSIGLYHLYEFTNKKTVIFSYFLLILPVLIMFHSIHSNFPIKKEEIKSSLNYIEKNIKQDEAIYLYSGSYRAFAFYEQTKIIHINNPIIVGASYRNENYKYKHELLNLKGKVWLLFSHVYLVRKKDNEEKYMMGFLLSNGSELLDVKKFSGSSVYYVDTKKL